MGWQFTPFSIIYFVTAAVGAAVAYLARKRRSTPGADALAGVLLAATIWALADGLESMTPKLSDKIVVSKVSHIGIQALSVLFLLFVMRYTRRDAWLTQERIALLWVVPCITVFMVFTNEWHYLIWTNVHPVSSVTGVRAQYEHGIAFWLSTAYNYGLMLVSTVVLVQSVLYYRDIYRQQAAVLLIAAAVPWIGNLIYLSPYNPLPGFDWTPPAFVVTGVLVAYAIFYLRLLDLVPVARNLLFEKMSDALLVLDSRDRVVDANQAAYQLLRPHGNLIGTTLPGLLNNEPAACSLIDGPYEVRNVISLTRDRTFDLDALCTPLVDNKGRLTGRLLVLRDITERVRMEEELRRSEEHYRSFLATVSHELRTPLTGILGMAEALQANIYGPLTDRQIRSLQLIEESGRHLSGVISDMLDLSRMEAGAVELQIETCLVDDLCRSSLAVVRGAALNKRQHVHYDIERLDLWIETDPHRVSQILIKLLNNAVKFTPEEGEIGLEVHALTSEPLVCFTVWDHGIGISLEDQERIFRPFTQIDDGLTRQYGGAGLGLTLVRHLTELHGGTVTLESEPSRGSRFMVTLPLTLHPMPAPS